MQPVVKRFFSYAVIGTQSSETSGAYPSTPSQTAFAERLKAECEAIGLSEAALDEYGYVTATLPSNISGEAQEPPVIGFFAHMDTSPDAPGENVNPRIVENYGGGEIALGHGRILSPEMFPELKKYIGQDIIVPDGATLLGADDKAGIAEILTAMEYLIRHPEIRHGKIRVAFTPDEEVGRGVDYFNVASFGADYAYTVDGGEIGELEAETFNAAAAEITVTGKSVHPGSAYGVMVNGGLVAAEIIRSLPANETPATTKGREGFYHLTGMEGEVGQAKLSYILRDFSAVGLEERKKHLAGLTARINEKYGAGTAVLSVKDSYRNMYEILKDKPQIVERARLAMEKAGVTPVRKAVRGGTDGARLSFMGLPCPNIFAGGHNFHGPYEYLPVKSMEAAVKVIVNICAEE
ncbi:MAG: peptidase T [Clostridiales bacterium]|jgi:tripeptide aminopeptidase|nr:peptidase T [Clostridiales bacterium]